MSLKREFNRIISAKTHKICEVNLFRDLMEAIKNTYKYVYVKEYHGNKQQVAFDYSISGFTLGNVVCELCDLLLIFEKENIEHQNEIRYTFLQAKYDRKGIRNHKFNCSLRQHYLLSQFPHIIGLNGFAIPSKILQNHITDSIGTFGIFIEDNHIFDMVYSIANNINLYPVKNINYIRNNGNRLHEINCTPAIKRTNGYPEKIFCNDLDEFEMAANHMLIGNPVKKYDSEFITNIILSLSDNDTERQIYRDLYDNVITLSDLKFNIIYINLDNKACEEQSVNSKEALIKSLY